MKATLLSLGLPFKGNLDFGKKVFYSPIEDGRGMRIMVWGI